MTPVADGAARDEPAALFVQDGDLFHPTPAATGPWSPNALHGAAVAGLLAGLLEHNDSTLASVQVDLLTPVPLTPLRRCVEPRSGGGRVTRQVATLVTGDKVVARARGLCVRRTELDVPPAALALAVDPGDGEVPELIEPGSGRLDRIAWPWFGSLAVATRSRLRKGADSDMVDLWMRLTLPIVAGTEITGVQRAVTAADYGAVGLRGVLAHDQWTFPNADLTVQLAREPVGPWVRLSIGALVQPVGVALTSSTMFDTAGHLGQATQTLVVGKRRAP